MRSGVPSASIAQILGAAPESRAARRRAACSAAIMSGELKARKFGTMWRGYGALWRKPPGASIVPSSSSAPPARGTVWKPFECAERPRIAWNATGRAVRRRRAAGPRRRSRRSAARTPARSAVSPISRASLRMRVGRRCRVIAAAHSGVHGATRSRSSWNDGATRRAVGERVVAFERRIEPSAMPSGYAALIVPRRSSKTSLLCGWRPSPGGPSPDRGRARTCLRAAPSSRITSCGALV